MTVAEEEELVQWMILKLTATGFAPKHTLVREMAEAIQNHRPREINDEYILLTEYAPFGQDWVRNFIRRHPQLQTVVGKSIESLRIEGTMPETLQKWFNEYKEQVIDNSNVPIENVYNMDESSFSIGSIKAGRVIVDLNARSQFRA